MSSKKIKKDVAELKKEFRSYNFEKAYNIGEKIPIREAYEGRYYCALMLEEGWIGEAPDLEKAYAYFEEVIMNWGKVSACLGCIRIMLSRKNNENVELAITLCKAAMVERGRKEANLYLGRVYEELCDPSSYKKAKRAYIKASWHGSATANLFYIRSLWRSGNKIGAILLFLPIRIINLIYRLIYGKQTFDGIRGFANTLRD